MFLYKGTSGSGGYSILDWELNTSIQPFSIRVAYPYFPYTWHKDFSISANNINDNIESVVLVVETFEKILISSPSVSKSRTRRGIEYAQAFAFNASIKLLRSNRLTLHVFRSDQSANCANLLTERLLLEIL
jgi:hypothetical protein